jgi:FkbM family methyltransferase
MTLGIVNQSTNRRAELAALLAESEEAAARRAERMFDDLAGPLAHRLVLYGAGNLGRKTLRGLRELGIEPLAFSDANPKLWDADVDGLRVLSPTDAVAAFGDVAVFVITIWGGAPEPLAVRRQFLMGLGARVVVSFGYLYWKYPGTFLPHYAFDLPQKVLRQRDAIVRAFSLWADDPSRAEYVAQIRWRLHLDFDALPPPVDHETYIASDLFTLSSHEVFVDCGAYDGDTIAAFLRATNTHVNRIIAFEPDGVSFRRCQEYLASLPEAVRQRIELWPFALGAQKGTVSFSQGGLPSSSIAIRAPDADRVDVACVSLDDVLTGKSPTFIKMDIEGAEPDAILGAKTTIASRAPILTVCSYHQQDHVWSIPLLISSVRSDYRFYLRPHLVEVWDLVCYAVPPDRHNSARRDA